MRSYSVHHQHVKTEDVTFIGWSSSSNLQQRLQILKSVEK